MANEYRYIRLKGQEFQVADLLHDFYSDVASYESWEQDFYLFLDAFCNEKPIVSIFSSGSTGHAKEISIRKEDMISSAKRTALFFEFKKGEKVLLAIPCKFIGGAMMVVRALVFGLDLYLERPQTRPYYHPNITFDFAPFTPMQAFALLQDQEGKRFLSRIRQVILGGSEVTYALEQQLISMPNAIFSTYGMTETVSHIALRKLTGAERQDCYQALSGISFASNDEACLIIHIDGLLIPTNDVVELIDNNRMKMLGRIDNRVNSGGLKIYPEKIESFIRELVKPSNNFFLFGRPDPKYGERLCLLEEVGLGEESSFSDEIRLILFNSIEKNKLPKDFYSSPQFEYTTNGKLNRKESIQDWENNLN